MTGRFSAVASSSAIGTEVDFRARSRTSARARSGRGEAWELTTTTSDRLAFRTGTSSRTGAGPPEEAGRSAVRDGNSTIPDGPADVSQADQSAGIVGEPGAVQVIVGTDAT